MSEHNKRVFVVGAKAAEKDFTAYVAERLKAEGKSSTMAREVRELKRTVEAELRELERERSRG